MSLETKTPYRPAGPKELALIVASRYREFPPCLPEQPIFYPVLPELERVPPLTNSLPH